MAIPRGYKRGSGGFLQPLGRVPSGTTSGPGHHLAGLTRRQLPATPRETAAYKRILASYEKAQEAHDRVMSGIAKAEASAFDRINDALIKSKESDPKDKLGNTVPSKQTQFLEAQLINMLGQRIERGRKLTPPTAGMEPGQIDPATGKLPIAPGETVPAPGEAPAPKPGLRPAYRTPIKGTKMIHPQGEVTLTGNSRTGPTGVQEVEATMGGRTGWVPIQSLQPVQPEGEGGLSQLRRFYNPPDREFQPF